MGEDKGLMKFKGKLLVQHALEVLSKLFAGVVIVTGNSGYANFGFKIIDDRIINAGPAGGILSALNHSRYEHNFISACDMPFINEAAVSFMIENSSGAEITVPVFKGKMQPLFGVYSSTCLSKWEEYVINGERKLELLVRQFRLRLVDVDSYEFFNDKTFANMNTPDDIKTNNG